MPITYEFDSDRELVSMVARGKVTPQEALDAFDRVIADPGFHPGMHVLSDHRALETVFDVGFVAAFVARVVRNVKLFKGSRCAFVESGGARYGMARMASMLLEPTRIDLRAFRDYDAARHWVAGGEDASQR